MDIVRRNPALWPFDDFERLRDEINQLFDGRPAPAARGLFDRVHAPRVDVRETPESVIVECDVPGVEQEDLQLTIERNMLTLRGTKRVVRDSAQGERADSSEIWAGEFQRTVLLPETVDADKIEAELHNGVLHVTIGKREELKPKRIAVNVH